MDMETSINIGESLIPIRKKFSHNSYIFPNKFPIYRIFIGSTANIKKYEDIEKFFYLLILLANSFTIYTVGMFATQISFMWKRKKSFS